MFRSKFKDCNKSESRDNDSRRKISDDCLDLTSETINSERRQRVRWVLPSLLGQSLKALNFSNCKMIGDKILMKDIYMTFDARCPNLERLTMGQSFFFQPELVSRVPDWSSFA